MGWERPGPALNLLQQGHLVVYRGKYMEELTA